MLNQCWSEGLYYLDSNILHLQYSMQVYMFNMLETSTFLYIVCYVHLVEMMK